MGVVVRGCLVQIAMQLPCPPCAEEGKKSEEHARQFKPKNAREFYKWLPDGFSKAPAAAHQPPSGLPRLSRRPHGLLPHLFHAYA